MESFVIRNWWKRHTDVNLSFCNTEERTNSILCHDWKRTCLSCIGNTSAADGLAPNILLSVVPEVVIVTSWNGRIFRVTVLLCSGFPTQRDSNADLWYFCSCQPEQTVKQTLYWPVIWDAMTAIWRHRHEQFIQCKCIRCVYTNETIGVMDLWSSQIIEGLNLLLPPHG